MILCRNDYQRKSSYLLRWLMGPASIVDGVIRTVTLGFVSSGLEYQCAMCILKNESVNGQIIDVEEAEHEK
jgi:hypothetical protein